MKLTTKIYLNIGFILSFFAIVTGTYLVQSNKVEQEFQKVLVSSELLRESEQMQKSLLDLETGLRGYLISENESFLTPYHTGQKEIANHYRQAKLLIEDSTESRILKEITVLHKNWVSDFSSKVVEAKRKSLQDRSYKPAFDSIQQNVVKAGYGKSIMDNIRAKFDEFDNYNNKTKLNRVQSLNKALKYTRYISIGLTILAILVGILTAFFLGRTIHRRLTTMISMAEDISQGDFKAQVTDRENDELSRLSSSLNLMAGKLNLYFNNLTKTNKELDQFAYVVSHDLKAPLRAINNLAEWIAEDLQYAEPEIKQNLLLMRGRAARMENLINGILAYSKIGRKETPKETFNIKELVREVIDSLAPPANFLIELPPNNFKLTTEKILLQQVLSNLISNGIKYNNKPNGIIKIAALEKLNEFEFGIWDNGPGIPEKYHERIFGIFQTMEARDTRESTGIGLAIVKKIIEEKGGSIKVNSKENEFTEAIFTWPKSG